MAIKIKISAAFNTPSIDLLVSSIIGRLRNLVSCISDPAILLIDTFIINWDQFTHSYCVVGCFFNTDKNCGRKVSMIIVVPLVLCHLGIVLLSLLINSTKICKVTKVLVNFYWGAATGKFV